MAQIACYGMPMHRRISSRHTVLPALALSIACVLGGCSGESNYPSLASRPAERLIDTNQPVAPSSPDPIPATASADLAPRLDHVVAVAQGARHDFADQQASAEKLVGAAGTAPAGSEDWARATQALSGLQAARSLTAQPLADLDRLEIKDDLAHPAQPGTQGSRPDAIAIATARDTVAALVAEEDDVLAKLDGRLAR